MSRTLLIIYEFDMRIFIKKLSIENMIFFNLKAINISSWLSYITQTSQYCQPNVLNLVLHMNHQEFCDNIFEEKMVRNFKQKCQLACHRNCQSVSGLIRNKLFKNVICGRNFGFLATPLRGNISMYAYKGSYLSFRKVFNKKNKA